MAPNERPRSASLAIAAIGVGPFEPVLDQLQQISRAAMVANPGLRAKCSAEIEQLRAIMALDWPAFDRD
jgi:hypothetical protein